MSNAIDEQPEDYYRSVGIFANKTEQNLVLFLEVLCEEIHLSPNHEIELFVENDASLFPMTFIYHSDCIQIYSNGINKWYFKFNGKMYQASYPSILSELE